MEDNNKGFTLIELIATISIMLLITVIAVPTILGASERKRIDQCKSYAIQFETIAELVVSDHKNDAINCDKNNYTPKYFTICTKTSNTKITYITLNTLQEYDYLDKIEINPLTDETFDKYSKVQITITENTDNSETNYTFDYKYVDKDGNEVCQ